MATAKLATLVIRTLAKPISSMIKRQAQTREPFRNFCVSLAQTMHRAEVNLRLNLLGQPHKSIRPLNEAAAIENGANSLAEGFLFAVAASLVIGESYRSSMSTKKRAMSVDDQIDDLDGRMDDMNLVIHSAIDTWEERWKEEKQRNDELTRILERIVNHGIRGGLVDTPLQNITVLGRPPEQSSSTLPTTQVTSSPKSVSPQPENNQSQ